MARASPNKLLSTTVVLGTVPSSAIRLHQCVLDESIVWCSMETPTLITIMNASHNAPSRTYDWFFRLCHEAGPESCKFYAPNVKQRFDDLLAKLEIEPLVYQNNFGESTTVTRIVLLRHAFQYCSDPASLYARFPALASNLDWIAEGRRLCHGIAIASQWLNYRYRHGTIVRIAPSCKTCPMRTKP
jgi:hypothetical protein